MHYPWARMASLTALGRGRSSRSLDELIPEIEEEVEAGRFDQAVALLERASEEAAPEHRLALAQARAWTHLQAAHFEAEADESRRRQSILTHLERARRLIAVHPGILEDAAPIEGRLAAIVALAGGRFKRALRLYPDERPLFLSYARWTVERSLIATAAGQPGEARERLEALLGDDDAWWEDDASLREIAAHAYAACVYALRDREQAVLCLTGSVEAGREEAVSALAYAHYRRGLELAGTDADTALKHWRDAAALDPDSKTARAAIVRVAHAYAREAYEAWRRGEPARAARAWAKEIELDPESPGARLGLAVIAFSRRDWERALAESERAAGASAEAGLNLKLIHLAALVMAGDVARARDEAKSLALEMPGDVEIEALWGLLSVATGRLLDGYRILSVLAQDTAHPLALYGAALCAQARGKRKIFRRLVEEYRQVRGEAYPPLPSESEESADAFARSMAERIVQSSLRFAPEPVPPVVTVTEPPEPAAGRIPLPGLRWWTNPQPPFSPVA